MVVSHESKLTGMREHVSYHRVFRLFWVTYKAEEAMLFTEALHSLVSKRGLCMG